ncbi:MAG: ATP-grasp domain-containing protein [Candidatus Helarchaeota archaeon]
MILIVSFNARPIAELAKLNGLEVAIVDFWGDRDLSTFSNKVFTIFKPELKSYGVFPNQQENEEHLVDLAIEVISENNIDSVIIGSGLDDRPDLWEKLGSRVPILGSSPACIKSVRDLFTVQKLLQQKRIRFPKTVIPAKTENLRDLAEEIGFPLVVKPKKSMGGVGIQLFRDPEELMKFFDSSSTRCENYYIQEYINGINISTTMIGNGDEFQVLSINEQLIGIPQCGTKMPFKYCGNIVPFKCSSDITSVITKAAREISKCFPLKGIFGIDFVLKEGRPYFMELNPRFPGSLELLPLISQINPMKLHLRVLKGYIPKRMDEMKGIAMKCILFAKEPFITVQFKESPYIRDIPYPNIALKPEDPICTLIMKDKSRGPLQKRMNELIHQIEAWY